MKEKIPDSVGYFKNVSRFSKKFLSVFLAVIMPFTTLWALPVFAAIPDVTITVNTGVSTGVSGLDLGVTYTHFMWEEGNTTAVYNAKLLLGDTIKYQNQHIMGWGADNIWPDPNGPINWSSLDSRVKLMQSMGANMVLTFCSAPGWMKTKGVDWNMDDRVADAYVQDYAKLCAQIAARYPDVKYFQIWNEFKGYWDDNFKYQCDNQGGWNYQKYTDFYNAVYDAVKAVRADAVIGGFYLPLSGDGAGSILGQNGSGTNMPLSDHDRECLDYWLANKHGADFISVDRWLVAWQDNYNGYTSEQILSLTEAYQKAIEDIRLKTNLPIWFSEYYTVNPNGPYGASFNGQQVEAAAMASTYYHMVKGAGGSDVTALLWNPMEGEVCDYLFTDTGSAIGAQPSPHYNVYKGMHDYFGRGTPLVQAVSSDPKIEVLASAQKVMIINKYNAAKTFILNGSAVDTLQPFEVKFVNAPNNMIQNGGFENDLTGWNIADSSTGHIATDSVHSGQKSVNFWFPAGGTNTLDYSISNCAAGSYTAEMWVRCGGTFTGSFEAYQGTTLLKSTPIASNDAWTKYTLANFSVSEESDVHIKITLNTGASVWLYFDDFNMVPSDPFVLQPVNLTTDTPALMRQRGSGCMLSPL